MVLTSTASAVPSPKTLALILLLTIQYTRRTPEASDPNVKSLTIQ
jgi:hypothetical protein